MKKTLLILSVIITIIASGCEKEKMVQGDWYKFLVYYKGVRTGQFHLLVEVKKPNITMYQDSEGERTVYSGRFYNDTILEMQDVINGNGEFLGKYSDTSIVLVQYDYTYIGKRSRF